MSGFVCSCHGFMHGEIDGKEMKSYLLFKAGTHREGWFTNDDLIAQYLAALPLFLLLHPDADLCFAFDNSMSHHKRPADGLDATLMTKGGVKTNLL